MLRCITTCATLLVWGQIWTHGHAQDKGFELHFKSQLATFHEKPVAFEKNLPPWIRGTLTRNGLGRFEMGHRRFRHAFDGYAKLTSWRFVSPNLTLFSTQFVGTSFYEKSLRRDDIAPYLMFDAPIPDFSWWEKLGALFKGIDNTNINVHRFGPRGNSTTVAVSDFWQSYSFDPSSLATTDYIDADVPGGSPFGSTLPLPSTAHPLPEFGSTDFISFVSLMNPVPLAESYIRLIRIKSARERERIVDIPVAEVPYMHSFGLSQNYATITAAPLYVNIATMLATANPVHSLDWKPDHGLTLHVVHLATKQRFEVKVEAMFPMHFINSYEDGNLLFLDYVTYPDINFIKSLKIETLLDPVKRNDIILDCRLVRYIIDVKYQTIQVQDIAATPGMEFINKLDMPAINPNYLHRKYCYVYGIVLKADDKHTAHLPLVKKDMCSPGNDLVWYKKNHYPSEPIFIPNPRKKGEDHGVLLSVVLDGRKGVSYLGVFNARTMKLINRSYLPIHIPYTLHGQFFPDET